jgi:uncharacterized protein
MNPGSTIRWVRCPACGGDSRFASDNPFRPFCCARCKDIDLGAWASESFRVSADAPGDYSPALESPNLQ